MAGDVSVNEAARLLQVPASTIRNWIAVAKIPYVDLPNGTKCIPLRGLVASLPQNYDLPTALQALAESDDHG